MSKRGYVSSRWDQTPALKKAREVADRLGARPRTPPPTPVVTLADEIGSTPELNLPELEGGLQDCVLSSPSPILIKPHAAVRRITFNEDYPVASTSTTTAPPLKIKVEKDAEVPRYKPVLTDVVANELFDVKEVFKRKELASGLDKEILVLMLRVAHSLERVTLLLTKIEEKSSR